MGACLAAMNRQIANKWYGRVTEKISESINKCDQKEIELQKEHNRITLDLDDLSDAIKKKNGLPTLAQKTALTKLLTQKKFVIGQIEQTKQTRFGLLNKQSTLATANEQRDNVDLMGYINKATKKMKITSDDISTTVDDHVSTMADVAAQNNEIAETLNAGDNELHETITDQNGITANSVDAEVNDFLSNIQTSVLNDMTSKTFVIDSNTKQYINDDDDDDENETVELDTKNKEIFIRKKQQKQDNKDNNNNDDDNNGNGNGNGTDTPMLLLKSAQEKQNNQKKSLQMLNNTRVKKNSTQLLGNFS